MIYASGEREWMYRAREPQALLAPYGEIVAASATGPGALDFGNHLLLVVRVA